MDERLRLTELGFLQIQERPTPEELQRHYAERYYQAPESSSYKTVYSDEEIQFREARAELKRFAVAPHLGGSSPGRLLDVGCGEGWLLSVFQRGGGMLLGLTSRAAVSHHKTRRSSNS